MWILPQSLISLSAPGTEDSTSDSKELSQICGRSLTARGNQAQSSYYLRAWNRGTLTRLQSGAISNPSRGERFLAAWTSSLVATPVSPSVAQGSDLEEKTLGTSGHLSQAAFDFFDQECASLKTSRATLPKGCITFSTTWEDWVIERRGDYSQRVKSAHRTSESGCSSWPTATVKDSGGIHPTEWINGKARSYHNGTSYGATLAEAVKHGQAAPVNHSFGGSRQELWLTPRANEPDNDPNFAARNADRGAHCHGTLSSQAKEHQGQKHWPTPDATNANDGTPWEQFHASMMERRAQVKMAVAEGKTKPGSGRSPNLAASVQNPQWATPIVGDSHLASTPEVAQKRIQEGKITLSRQNPGTLNPRWVETLMGLPVGWVMQSCATPVTIAPTNSVCSETE